MTCLYKRPNIEVKWYGPDSEDSQKWQETEDGFGQARNKSFRKGCLLHPSTNRKGNENGEMGGQILFFKRASAKTDYSRRNLEPTLEIHATTKIFAKVFLNVPMGMMPIGENNLPYIKPKKSGIDLKGYGPCLLAPVVRAIALFVNVDGVQQTNEIFCVKSSEQSANMTVVVESDENENDEEPRPLITAPIPGSFVTFCPSRVQDKFFFIHLPILCTHDDCLEVEIGEYSLTVADSFQKLFCTLSPGKHDIRVSAQIYYTYDEFRYFLLDKDINPLGKWRDGLKNEFLKSPFEDTNTLRSPDTPIAEGQFTVDMPFNFAKMFDGMLDRKPPKEKYAEDDLERIRKDAGTIAVGKFSKMFDVTGFPDITVLTSHEQDQSDKDKDGNKFTFKVIEFVASWLDANDSSPAGTGQMFEGAMAKGQTSVNDITHTWSWINRKHKDVTLEPVPIPVKNRHILKRMVDRRRSQVEAMGEMPKRLIELSKKMGAEQKDEQAKEEKKKS